MGSKGDILLGFFLSDLDQWVLLYQQRWGLVVDQGLVDLQARCFKVRVYLGQEKLGCDGNYQRTMEMRFLLLRD